MEISVHFVEGQSSSACKGDAFSVVDGGKDLITLIPARKGLTVEIVKAAFEAAAESIKGRTTPAGEKALLCHHARKTLGA